AADHAAPSAGLLLRPYGDVLRQQAAVDADDRGARRPASRIRVRGGRGRDGLGRSQDAHYEWPSVAEVQAYRDKVRALVLRLIDEAPLSLPIAWDHPWWAIVMGIEHERIHLETSSVLIRQHKLAYVKPHSAWQPCTQTGDAPQNTLVKVPAGKVVLGR